MPDYDSGNVKKNIVSFNSAESMDTDDGGAVSAEIAAANSIVGASVTGTVLGEKRYLMDEFTRRKRARQLQVTIDDNRVKEQLRHYGEPACYFGEDPADRRSRLRNFLSRLGDSEILTPAEQQQRVEMEQRQWAKQQQTGSKDAAQRHETWYHQGSDDLMQSRFWIADYSIPRAKERLQLELQRSQRAEPIKQAEKQQLQKQIQAIQPFASQVGDTRPIAFCRFSPGCDPQDTSSSSSDADSSSSRYLATCSWTGVCKVWSVPQCETVLTLQGHSCSAGAIVFHPHSTRTQQGSDLNLASCAHDGSVKLWSLDSEEPLADVEGHGGVRVSRLEFHPSGRFLGTCCFDNSWRLWDLEHASEILHQEGHDEAVYDLDFHPDGSLAASAGLDAYGRIWDLRSGSCIIFLEGHLKSILSIKFSPLGNIVATGSSDHTCKIWDLRKRSCLYTIPSHQNLISSICFEPTLGRYMVTASYDGLAKVWSADTWQPLHTLTGHDSKIMGLDISADCKYIATSSYDRTFKLWSSQ